MKKILLVATCTIVISFLKAQTDSTVGKKQKEFIASVTTLDGRTLKGSLSAVNDTQLILKANHTQLSVPAENLKSFTLKRKHSVRRGALIGFGIGAAAGIIIGLASGVRALAVGEFHSCALLQAGGMKCWGDNWDGELGTGVIGPEQTTPVDVPGLTSGVHAISARSFMTCAVTDAGAAKCWGYGIVGDGNPDGSSPTPVAVAGLSSGVVAITQGALHVCAQLVDGVRCWGRNDFGQLGDGSRETRLVPTDVVGLGGPVEAVSAGSQHTCALMATGALKCWGSNAAGQVGDGTAEGIPLPQTVVVPGDPIFFNGFE